MPDPISQERREAGEPSELTKPLPWFMVMLIGAVATWGVTYIVSARLDLGSAYGDSRTPAALMAQSPSEGSSSPSRPDGAAIYAARCTPCHQASGAGIAGMFPPLAGSEWVLGDERVLVQVPLHGIQGNLDVKGQTYKGTMPAFASLSDDEIAAVLSHVRSQWGNTAPSVTAAVVAAGRAKNASRVGPWSSGDEIRRGAAP